MLLSEINRENVEEIISKIELEKIPERNYSIEYYLIYNEEFYPPKYILEQMGIIDINSQIAVRKLEELGFEILRQDNNEKVLKIILRKFIRKVLEKNDMSWKNFVRKAKYKNFDLNVAFGSGKFSGVPFISLLKDGNSSTNGVYPSIFYIDKEQKISSQLSISRDIPEKLKKIITDINKEKEIIEEIQNKNRIKFDYKPENEEEIINKIINNLDKIIEQYEEITKNITKGEISMENKCKKSLNKILYGPPGTGKTYNVVNMALDIIENGNNEERDRDIITEKFKKYKEMGQIVFTTFHQSYGYEEFIEGFRSNESGGFEIQDGIFKLLCKEAKQKNRQEKFYEFKEDDIRVFKISLGNTQSEEDANIFEYCINENVISIGYGRDLDYTNCSNRNEISKLFKEKYPDDTEYNITAIDYFKNIPRENDLVFVSNGNRKCRAIARITGEYYFNKESEIRFNHFRKVEWLCKDIDVLTSDLLIDKNFSQQTVYQILNKFVNFEKVRSLVGKKIENKNNKYVMIIDEINRGNISKIFGELITLIEEDKREGEENEISVTLPYSFDKFTIPNNVYIIGTMNTADRSIALLDTALRRRFTFIEMMPKEEKLREVEGIDLRNLLTIINKRIEYLYDREHTIGHSYLINCNTVEEVMEVMQKKILPLIQEYFYDEWEKIELILGGSTQDIENNNYFLYKEKLNNNIFNKKVEFIEEEKYRYYFVKNPSVNAINNLLGIEQDERD